MKVWTKGREKEKQDKVQGCPGQSTVTVEEKRSLRRKSQRDATDTGEGWCPRRTVNIWSYLLVMVRAGVCVSVIHSSTIFHSQKRLYSDEKLCGLPIMKSSEESNFSEKK